MRLSSLATMLCWFSLSARASTFFVATNGSDANPGTLAAPLLTLEAAQTLMRSSPGSTVYLRGGTYLRTNTFALSAEDTGVYSAYNSERVYVIGGVLVTNWTLVSGDVTNRLIAPEAVYTADLSAHGVTDYGTLQRRGAPGWNVTDMPVRSAALELFYNSAPMRLAQYPNGATTWDRTTNVTGPTYTATNYGYMDPRPARWQNDLADVWGYGFWQQNWADSHLKIYAIDTNAQRADIVGPMDRYGWAVSGGRFQWQNVFDELDEAGEYYVDRTNGVLYFYPPTPLESGTAYVSTVTNLISVVGAANLSFVGIDFAVCRGFGFSVSNTTNIAISRCRFYDIGNYAILATNVAHVAISYSTFTATGDGGIILEGGDRDDLASSYNSVTDCTFSELGYFDRMDHAAVKTYGVGSIVSNCQFQDLPQNAIRLFGNNHIVQYSFFTNCVAQAGDAGVIYGTKDWSGRGCVIRYNFFQATHGLDGDGVTGTVYLDDGTSGATVYSNIFYDCYAVGQVMVGGGRDNVATNNIMCNFISDHYPNREVLAYHLDGRYLPGQWASEGTNTQTALLQSVPYTSAVWTASYPHINDMLTDTPAAPMYNQFTNNIITYPYWRSIYNEAKPYWNTNEYTTNLNIFDPSSINYAKSNPGFVGMQDATDFTNMTLVNFVLTNNAPALLRGFRQIPVGAIGVRDWAQAPVHSRRNAAARPSL